MYDGAVTRADLDLFHAELNSVLQRLDGFYSRTESKKHARQYVRGLLSPLERKNGWTLAEYAGEDEPKALQRFLNLSPWDAGAVLGLNREYAMEQLADPEAILVADPTGFPKKGTKSVGVQRQYSGTLGRVDNCQIATFLAYVTPDGDRVLLDRRLYLPEHSWLADPERRAAAGIPDDVTFQTRPVQVTGMVDAALAAEVPFSWFTADEEFGQNPGLCARLEDANLAYVMAIPKNTQFRDHTGQRVVIEKAVQDLPERAWTRRACGVGSKGYRTYDWALLTSDDGTHQYMARRSIDDGELAYYHCYNPRVEGFSTLVRVAGSRWPIEDCFGSAKNETGLDHYQVRTWDAWHRHITLAMLANTVLAVIAHKAKKRGAN